MPFRWPFTGSARVMRRSYAEESDAEDEALDWRVREVVAAADPMRGVQIGAPRLSAAEMRRRADEPTMAPTVVRSRLRTLAARGFERFRRRLRCRSAGGVSADRG
jgi:hypothetical protein